MVQLKKDFKAKMIPFAEQQYFFLRKMYSVKAVENIWPTKSEMSSSMTDMILSSKEVTQCNRHQLIN